MARTSILRSKILAQGGIHFRRASQIKWGPRRASDLWGGLAVVHVGDNGDVSQMFVLHTFYLLTVRQDHAGPRKAGRAVWRVQVFYEVKSWRKAEFTSAAQVKSNGAPAGRQTCGAVLPWSTWAIMATFLRCSFCISGRPFLSQEKDLKIILHTR